MTTPDYHHIHFTGIGGVGMAGLGLICRDLGISVSGSDMAMSRNIDLLKCAGATVSVGHAEYLPDAPDLLVYSSAVPADNPERTEAAKLNIPQHRRGEFLAEFAMRFETRVSCAGSHGKTSISAMLTHILATCGRDPGYLIGGQPVNLDRPASAGAGNLLVTEVDESDGTQALMQSTHAIISNIEDDHCWSLGGPQKLYDCFRTFAFRSDQLVAWDTPKTRELLNDHPSCQFVGESFNDLTLPVPGRHNQINATLAVIMAETLGVTLAESREALKSFHGVDRRMSLRFSSAGTVVIEDYAHHPTEVAATIDALREAYPEHTLHVIFQPHRFERIARYAAQFSNALSAADAVTVTAPFAAWIDDADRCDPKQIADGITAIPAGYSDAGFEDLAVQLSKGRSATTLFAVLGAGSITKLVPHLTKELDL